MLDILANPSCNDIAWKWILTLFGTGNTGCDVTNAADVNSAYAQAFMVFTSVLSYLAGLFITYHVLAGIISTAQSGKVMEDKWHQVYAPIRMVVGFGLLIPVSDGFSSVHYILRDVIARSAIQLANGVINTYVIVTTSKNAVAPATKISSLSGKKIANDFFEKAICKAMVDNMSARYYVYSPYSTSRSLAVNVNAIKTWAWGDCGKIVLTKPAINSGSVDGIFSTDIAKTAIKNLTESQKSALETMKDKIFGENGESSLIDFEKLGKYLDENSSAIIDSKSNSALVKGLIEAEVVKGNIPNKINEFAKEYNTAMSLAATKAFTDIIVEAKAQNANFGDNDKKLDVTEYGFMSAGAYERSLSAVSSLVSGMANSNVAVTKPDFDEDTNKKYHQALSAILSSRALYSTASGDDITESNSDDVTSIVGAIFSSSIDNMYSGEESTDPVGEMIMFGNNLLTIASYVIIGMLATKAAAGFAGGNLFSSITGFGGAMQAVVDYLASWVGWVVMMMIIVGLMHSFVLPMLPTMMIFAMGSSWLVMFLEASVAGVLWAFVFIRMDGKEFLDQKQSPGAALMFNLLLRPALGMLAFCGMLVLLPAMLNALNKVWATTFTLQTGNQSTISLVGLWQWVAQIVMFCWMQWTMTLRMTTLIPTIADKVGSWMGMGSSQGFERGETEALMGGLIAASGAISKAPVSGQNMVRRPAPPPKDDKKSEKSEIEGDNRPLDSSGNSESNNYVSSSESSSSDRNAPAASGNSILTYNEQKGANNFQRPEKGDKGDTGSRGDQGIQGIQGRDGEDSDDDSPYR